MPSSLAPLLWFAAIIALIPVALWLLKRSPAGAMAMHGELRSVATLALSPNQRIVTIEVGSGADRRWLVLGVTPQNVTLLHEMPPQADAPAAVAAPGSSFAQLLGRSRGGAARDGGRPGRAA
ncbi:MAG TPA: flagellar biosynthetic protein FliO [Burkholderiaceae bacterium]|nr:flagellar biosynthetic protein FliO [Burkholderiaceae bacterium]